jgi:hypothetical protein
MVDYFTMIGDRREDGVLQCDDRRSAGCVEFHWNMRECDLCGFWLCRDCYKTPGNHLHDARAERNREKKSSNSGQNRAAGRAGLQAAWAVNNPQQ